MIRVLGLTLTMAALLLGSACSSKKADDAPTDSSTPSNVTLTPDQRRHIQLYAVAPSSFHRSVETTGVVDFDNDQATSVVAPFSGPVTKLLVSSGDQVSKGQPLALLDSADFSAAVGAYRKALVTARNARKLADADQDLVRHDGVAQREALQSEVDASSADADREAARQALLAMGVDAKTISAIQAGRTVLQDQAVIRAPIAGTLVEKLITPGQLLQAGSTTCFTVADLSRVWVMAQVSTSELAAIAVGDPASVDAGEPAAELPGRVDNIAALVNSDTRAVAARVVVENPQGRLKKQMYVRVRIESRQPSRGVLIPVSAILHDDENLPFVYAMQKDGSFARQHVTLGYRDGKRYAIDAGLKAGDQVVVDGGLFVQFMQNQ